MYKEIINHCDDRIVSISQLRARPIGKENQGKKVEFGSKLGLSLANGFFKGDTLSLDAYNEIVDLKIQAEAYKTLYGYYPELILADKIYATNDNRTWCKDNHIRLSTTPKRKPPKLSAYQKAKRKNASETWIGLTLFVVNIVKFTELNKFYF